MCFCLKPFRLIFPSRKELYVVQVSPWIKIIPCGFCCCYDCTGCGSITFSFQQKIMLKKAASGIYIYTEVVYDR